MRPMEVKARRSDFVRSETSADSARLCLRSKPVHTFPQLLDERVAGHGDREFLPRRAAREPGPILFSDVHREVHEVAAGLVALGIDRGDRVGLLAENRYEWLLADLGITYIGAVDVPRGSDTSPEEMGFILAHSGAVATFVADDATAQAVLDQRDALAGLQTLISLEARSSLPGVIGLEELMEKGRALLKRQPDALADRAAKVQPDDLLTIVYTSGTTAEPKGVMLTHANILSNIRNVCQVLHITGEDSFLSVLPAWHMYERIMDYLALAAGGRLIYTDRRNIKEDLRNESPTVFAAVPRIWEMIHDGIVANIEKLPGIKGKLMRGVLRLSREHGARRTGFVGRGMHALARSTVLKPIKAATGGRLRLAVSGGGALPKHVDEQLLGLGVPILNGYGLTETSPVAAVRPPEANEPYTIGPPIPETEIQARSPEGVVLGREEVGILWIRGPQIMRGYYKNEGRSRDVLDDQGWFNSGDLGMVQADGQVRITGRAKDTIVLAGGENVEPEPLETAIKTSPYIDQAVVVGQDQKALGALLVVHADCLETKVPREQWQLEDGWLQGEAINTLIRGELQKILTRDNGFRPMERVAAFRLMTEPMTPENGLLTHTLKVRRHVVHERFRDAIAAMFDRS